MTFIAPEPASVPNPPPEAPSVANDGFFPDIDLQRLRENVRLDGTVTATRLRDAVVDAVIYVNGQLAGWKADRQLMDGVASLDQMPDKIGGEGVKVRQYLSAIYHTVKADLNEKYANFDATKSGVEEADKLLQVVEAERRAASWSIKDVQGLARTIVELI